MFRHLTMVMALIAVLWGCHTISVQNKQTQQMVYELLDRDYLTNEEKIRVDLITGDTVDPIFIDEAHQQRFKYHFGEEAYNKRFVWKPLWKKE